MLPDYSRALSDKEDAECEKAELGSVLDSSTEFEHDSESQGFVRNGPHQRAWASKSLKQRIASFPAWKFAIVFLSVWGAVDISRRSFHAIQSQALIPQTPQQPSGDLSYYCRRACGRSMAEAEQRGCVWDELEFRFTRPECINKETQEDFLKNGPGKDGMWEYAIDVDWKHSASGHGNINDGSMTIVTSDQLLDLIHPGRSVWHSNLWHISHCLWYWRKVGLARFDGTLLPMGREEEAEHGYHCTRMINNYLRKEHLTDQFKTSFTF